MKTFLLYHEYTYPDIAENFLFRESYGSLVIGESFIIAKDPDKPDSVWSFVLTGHNISGATYKLIYKHPE